MSGGAAEAMSGGAAGGAAENHVLVTSADIVRAAEQMNLEVSVHGPLLERMMNGPNDVDDNRDYAAQTALGFLKHWQEWSEVIVSNVLEFLRALLFFIDELDVRTPDVDTLCSLIGDGGTQLALAASKILVHPSVQFKVVSWVQLPLKTPKATSKTRAPGLSAAYAISGKLHKLDNKAFEDICDYLMGAIQRKRDHADLTWNRITAGLVLQLNGLCKNVTESDGYQDLLSDYVNPEVEKAVLYGLDFISRLRIDFEREVNLPINDSWVKGTAFDLLRPQLTEHGSTMAGVLKLALRTALLDMQEGRCGAILSPVDIQRLLDLLEGDVGDLCIPEEIIPGFLLHVVESLKPTDTRYPTFNLPLILDQLLQIYVVISHSDVAALVRQGTTTFCLNPFPVKTEDDKPHINQSMTCYAWLIPENANFTLIHKDPEDANYIIFSVGPDEILEYSAHGALVGGASQLGHLRIKAPGATASATASATAPP